ncbi:hypothetical protein, partial [Merdimonas faecis]|uniref:hypothetical protein n=1 Tax=Merdimonas faecis TaxID=1653435 RepID=UPI0023F7FBC7
IIVNYSNSQRAGVILYLTALIFGAYNISKIKVRYSRFGFQKRNKPLINSACLETCIKDSVVMR